MRPLDVRIVVDLDALRRRVQREYGRDAFQQRALAGAFGQAADRVARAHSVAPRRQSRVSRREPARRFRPCVPPRMPSASASSARSGNFFADENQRWRRTRVVELADKGCQQFAAFDLGRMARKERPVAPVLAGAEKEHLDAGLRAFTVQRKHVGFRESSPD